MRWHVPCIALLALQGEAHPPLQCEALRWGALGVVPALKSKWCTSPKRDSASTSVHGSFGAARVSMRRVGPTAMALKMDALVIMGR